MTRQVVVTGVGLVCALGIGTEESWKNLLAGQSGVGPITLFDTTGFDCTFAGEVKNFDPLNWVEKKELKKMGRFIQVALAGAEFAVKMANWSKETENDLVDLGLLTDEELLQWKALQIKARYQPPTNGPRNGANQYPTTDFFGSARSRTVSSKGRLCKKSGESIRKRSLDRRRT